MGPLETLQQRISGFAGYATSDARRLADEQVRAYVGERLAALPSERMDALAAEDRERYDRVLLRCEFLNQQAFAQLDRTCTQKQLDALAADDVRLVEAAERLASGDLPQVLKEMESAFDDRDAAMTAP